MPPKPISLQNSEDIERISRTAPPSLRGARHPRSRPCCASLQSLYPPGKRPLDLGLKAEKPNEDLEKPVKNQSKTIENRSKKARKAQKRWPRDVSSASEQPFSSHLGAPREIALLLRHGLLQLVDGPPHHLQGGYICIYHYIYNIYN